MSNPRAAISVATSTGGLALLNRAKGPIPRPLALIPVNRHRCESIAVKPFDDLVCPVLGAAENQGPLLVRRLQELGQQVWFAFFVNHVHRLSDALSGTGDWRHLNRRRIGEPFVGELPDLLGHSGGEHQRLPSCRNCCHDPLQRWQKSHIEHLVGLVEHQDFDLRKVDVALFHQIKQAARRSNQSVDAVPQRLDLSVLRDAAEDNRLSQRRVSSVAFEAVADLRCQFAGRGEHQSANRPRLRPRSLVSSSMLLVAVWLLGRRVPRIVQSLEHRQRKGSRLTGASLSAADQVATGEYHGNRLRLNRSRYFVVQRIGGADKRLGQAKL